MTLRDQMPRTVCACNHCKVGCRTMPGMLGIGDAARIAAYLLEPHGVDLAKGAVPEAMHRYFVASEGAKVAKIDRCSGTQIFSIPTIAPAQKENGECVFYRDGGCLVHPVSPAGCALVDSHVPRDEGDVIVGALLAEINADHRADGPYSRLWHHLKNSGKVARPRLERRSAFEREFAKLGRCPPRTPPQSYTA